ncbi:MAG: integrase [Candidatus Zambryskibacteria bacterium RIFCSPLOWO2_01_FULL_39_39]|uniref:Integrase n=1 Tax=Candidatus Zambryskibacteria bacterium RIFCSPLOWO2_01_FULL_39_39 TaxID=1802758 RepID=A0A1G2TXR0_9BACT|nr:MAG: integrase [Candidatus Zambryskibacteria bacterium RIFCSPHIGHO2_01_FULL_39_63]OHB02081.1 MAG: integrase [Candidatus Zambryskibacteria bacterium RIFCSPLOWO2_01_FULL_39_39]
MKNEVEKVSDLFLDKNLIEDIFEHIDVKEQTKKEYCYFVRNFIVFMQNKLFNENSFLEFKKYLSERTNLSVATKNKYLTSARIFLKELNRRRIIPIDITHNIKSFSQSKKHKREGMSEKEIALLTKKVRQFSNKENNIRIKAILCLLTLQGLRQCEIVRLDVEDLDLVNNLIFVRGKGEDDKEPINLHPETSIVLSEYVKKCRIADGAVFTSWSNNNKGNRISVASLRQIIRELLQKLEIIKPVHGFRHYFTTKLINTYKGDLLEVARYTRHKSIEMLQVYNDNIKLKADLPRYYRAFEGVSFERKTDLSPL